METATEKQPVVKNSEGIWTVNNRPRETVKFISDVKSKNLPGKSCITVLITIPPGGTTPAHTHSGAIVFAYTLTGKMRNRMNDSEAFISVPGDTFHELPGCRHKLSENASDDPNEWASFYSTLILDTEVIEKSGYESLVVIDADVEEKKRLGGQKTTESTVPPTNSGGEKAAEPAPPATEGEKKPSLLKRILKALNCAS